MRSLVQTGLNGELATFTPLSDGALYAHLEEGPGGESPNGTTDLIFTRDEVVEIRDFLNELLGDLTLTGAE